MNRFLLPLAAAALLCSCSHAARAMRAPDQGERTLKVMTYNVNYGIPGDGPTLQAIADGNADVVFLEETTAEWEAWLRPNFSKRYAHISFRHCCGAGGLAVLSRFPFEEGEYIEPPDGGWFPGWRVLVHGPLGPVQVLAVHLRPPVSDSGSYVRGYLSATPPIRARQIAAYEQTLDPSLPTLVVGDFNENTHGRAVEYLRDHGYTDAVDEFAPGAPTWRWPLGPITLRGQLDHIAYDDKLEPLAVKVMQAGNSDHLPVVGVFALAR